jgi:ADP-heptose:LPS heptosyltransferase
LGGADTRIKKYYGARLGLILFKRAAAIPAVKERYNHLGTALDFPATNNHRESLDIPLSIEQQVSDVLSGFSGEFIAASPGSRWPMKRWPTDRYIQLFTSIQKQYGYSIMLLGDAGDREISGRIERALGDKVLNLTGQTSILEAAGYIRRCAGFIGNDSGLMHLAELVGVPVLALFGPTVEAFGYYPSLPESKVCERDIPCRPCSRNGSRKCPKRTQECLHDIPVQKVENAFLDLVQRKGPRRYILP